MSQHSAFNFQNLDQFDMQNFSFTQDFDFNPSDNQSENNQQGFNFDNSAFRKYQSEQSESEFAFGQSDPQFNFFNFGNNQEEQSFNSFTLGILDDKSNQQKLNDSQVSFKTGNKFQDEGNQPNSQNQQTPLAQEKQSGQRKIIIDITSEQHQKSQETPTFDAKTSINGSQRQQRSNKSLAFNQTIQGSPDAARQLLETNINKENEQVKQKQMLLQENLVNKVFQKSPKSHTVEESPLQQTRIQDLNSNSIKNSTSSSDFTQQKQINFNGGSPGLQAFSNRQQNKLQFPFKNVQQQNSMQKSPQTPASEQSSQRQQAIQTNSLTQNQNMSRIKKPFQFNLNPQRQQSYYLNNQQQTEVGNKEKNINKRPAQEQDTSLQDKRNRSDINQSNFPKPKTPLFGKLLKENNNLTPSNNQKETQNLKSLMELPNKKLINNQGIPITKLTSNLTQKVEKKGLIQSQRTQQDQDLQIIEEQLQSLFFQSQQIEKNIEESKKDQEQVDQMLVDLLHSPQDNNFKDYSDQVQLYKILDEHQKLQLIQVQIRILIMDMMSPEFELEIINSLHQIKEQESEYMCLYNEIKAALEQLLSLSYFGLLKENSIKLKMENLSSCIIQKTSNYYFPYIQQANSYS